MVSKQELPADWVVEYEQTTYDSMMGREYTTVIYRQEDTGMTVRINEVLERKRNAWGYYVHHSGPNGTLGTDEDLASAKHTALTFMNTSTTA
jgi:hypothetical protein